MQIAVIVFCGLLIGLAIYFFIRSMRNVANGRCCEGCKGCPQAKQCSSLQPGNAAKKTTVTHERSH